MMVKKIFVASTNKGKILEIKELRACLESYLKIS